MEFQTEHLLEVTAWHGQDQQFAYPFDTYILGTVFQAFLSGTNVSVPVLFLRISDATSSFQPILMQDADVRTLSLNGSQIIHARGVQYSFHRIALSQVFVMVLFVVNWLLTAVVLYIAVSAYDGVPMSEGVLILPVSVILTIPALRALWVDAPSFGESRSKIPSRIYADILVVVSSHQVSYSVCPPLYSRYVSYRDVLTPPSPSA